MMTYKSKRKSWVTNETITYMLVLMPLFLPLWQHLLLWFCRLQAVCLVYIPFHSNGSLSNHWHAFSLKPTNPELMKAVLLNYEGRRSLSKFRYQPQKLQLENT